MTHFKQTVGTVIGVSVRRLSEACKVINILFRNLRLIPFCVSEVSGCFAVVLIDTNGGRTVADFIEQWLVSVRRRGRDGRALGWGEEDCRSLAGNKAPLRMEDSTWLISGGHTHTQHTHTAALKP